MRSYTELSLQVAVVTDIDCLNIRVMVVSIGSRGSHIPAMTPRRKRLGVIAGM